MGSIWQVGIGTGKGNKNPSVITLARNTCTVGRPFPTASPIRTFLIMFTSPNQSTSNIKKNVNHEPVKRIWIKITLESKLYKLFSVSPFIIAILKKSMKKQEITIIKVENKREIEPITRSVCS